MQAVDGAARGLGLHLDRLNRANQELFGLELDIDRIRDCIRHALPSGASQASVRITVFSEGHGVRHAKAAEPDILVTISAAAVAPKSPLRVRSIQYERVLPHIKHVGTFGQIHHARRAQQDGFDDALFRDSAGSISEGSIWNIGFFDGSGVVWPSAPALAGITMQLVRAGLERKGIPSTTLDVRLADLPSFHSAFLTNSVGIVPIASIDEVKFVTDPEVIALIEDCYQSNPSERI